MLWFLWVIIEVSAFLASKPMLLNSEDFWSRCLPCVGSGHCPWWPFRWILFLASVSFFPHMHRSVLNWILPEHRRQISGGFSLCVLFCLIPCLLSDTLPPQNLNSVTSTQEGCQPLLRLSFPVLQPRNSPGSRQGDCGPHFVGCPSPGEHHPMLTVIRCLKTILGFYAN